MRVIRFCCALVLAMSAVAMPGGAAATKPGSDPILQRYEDVVYVPVDPAQPELVQIDVLRGDPNTGPSSMLMKMKKYQGALHTHSSDYELVLIAGRMRHWQKGQTEADTPLLGPGSYWYQPKNQPHGDSCLSEACVMFITWAGKRDAFPDK